MEGFTIIDGIVAVVVILSGILAYSRGLIRELLAIVGWVAAAILAFLFAPTVQPLVAEIPVLGDFLGDSCELAVIAAFAAVFALALVVASVFTPLFGAVVQRSALGGIDQALGFLFGVLRGILLVAVALVVYDRVAATSSVEVVDQSRTWTAFESLTTAIDEQVPADAPSWIVERYELLVGACDG